MAYIGNSPETTYSINVKEYVATAGQTVFPAVYGEFVEVHVNGLLLASTDYTATDGVQVILNVGATVGDEVRINGYADIATASGLVTSVAGRTGNVVLDKADVGLTNVDNTADVDKPVSTAQATALSNKVNTSDLTELTQDVIGSSIVAGNDITVSYNDTTGLTEVAFSGSISGGFTNMQVFNTSGTFNIASAKGAGVYYVECVGGGGGGGGGEGGGAQRWGQGGCGAGSVVGFATVSANVTVTIGAGGLGGAGGEDGNTGGDSSFGSFCTAGGGKGGKTYSGTPSRNNYPSSSIGVNFIGKIKNGTSGSRGSYTDSGGSSVGGSSAIGGGGNATGDGTANSGGGGGGGNTTGTQGYAGGSGYVVVMW